NSIGRSSILQSLSINGNEEEERSPPARQQGTTTMASALRPSVAECCRTVFAAFLWHEHLVKDAMAAAAYLKFHQHLQSVGYSTVQASGGRCELCDCSFKVPVTVHMRMNHPGCGQDAQGYLLCPTCRAQYLRKTPAGHRQERTRRWREFRLSTNAFDSRPEIIMRQNAMFLLDLNSSLDCDSK
ncbi:hypothetical protein ANCDUO_19765, partial [Ancylostoma duodenale]